MQTQMLGHSVTHTACDAHTPCQSALSKVLALLPLPIPGETHSVRQQVTSETGGSLPSTQDNQIASCRPALAWPSPDCCKHLYNEAKISLFFFLTFKWNKQHKNSKLETKGKKEKAQPIHGYHTKTKKHHSNAYLCQWLYSASLGTTSRPRSVLQVSDELPTTWRGCSSSTFFFTNTWFWHQTLFPAVYCIHWTEGSLDGSGRQSRDKLTKMLVNKASL